LLWFVNTKMKKIKN